MLRALGIEQIRPKLLAKAETRGPSPLSQAAQAEAHGLCSVSKWTPCSVQLLRGDIAFERGGGRSVRLQKLEKPGPEPLTEYTH